MVKHTSHKANAISIPEANAMLPDSATRKAEKASLSNELTDAKLLARVRRLIAEEHAGYVRSGYGTIEHACIEPGCSCDFGTSGPFRDPPVRCTSFEERVLPLDPGLEEAYRTHLTRGTALHIRRCAWTKCRKEVASVGPASKYCAYHAEVSRKRSNREAQRRHRDVRKLVDGTVDNQGLAGD